MSTDMQRLERARPQVEPPTPDARARARAELRKLIEVEAPGALGARWPDRPGGPRRPRRPRRRPQTSAFVFVGGSVGALIIAIGALILLHHRTAAPGRGAAAGPNVAGQRRGAIVTSDGTTLAGVRALYEVRVEVGSLPRDAAARRAEFNRLDRAILGSLALGECRVSQAKTELLGQMACIVAEQRARGLSDIGLASDQSAQQVRAIIRDRAAFPGVVLQRVEVRSYPQGGLAAQLLGTIGPITQPETREPRYHGVAPQAIIGQSGLEYEYDRDLGAGDTLHLSIDAALQRLGQRSLAHAIAANRPASGGAFVVMNPQNGQVLALGSAPTYDANVFTAPMTEQTYRHLFGPTSGEPQFNRAIASAGPVGSIFTPLTGLAALESGVWGVGESYDDTGQFCFPSTTLCLHNSGHAAYGPVSLAKAIRVEDDTFFDNLGFHLNAGPVTHPDGGALQQWARAFGIGQAPGIDLPGAASGALPTPAQTRFWTVGDIVDLASGQGDVQVTPLQVAVAYAAIANGGTVVTPHVGASVTNAAGATVETIDPAAVRRLELDPGALAAVRDGLRQVIAAPGGTAHGVFGGFPAQVYGKTGTAQQNGRQDDAWFAGYVPASATRTPIVVVVTVEQGGFGAVAAAPVARQIMSQWFFGKPGPYIPGTSTTL